MLAALRHEGENRVLQERVSHLETQLRHAKTAPRPHDTEALARVTEEARRWKEQHDTMKAAAQEMAYKAAAASKELAENKERHQNLLENHAAMQAKHRNTKDELAALRDKGDAASKLESDWRQHSAKWKSRCKDLAAKFEQHARHAEEQLKTHSAQSRAEHRRLETDLADARAALERRDDKVRRLTAKVKELESELKGEGDHAQLEKEVTELKAAARAKDKAYAALQRDHEVARSDIERFRKLLEHQQQTRASEQDTSKYHESVLEAKELQKTLKTHASSLSTLTEENKRLSLRLEKAQAMEAELAALKREMPQVKAALKEAAQHKAQLEALRKQAEELPALRKQAAEVPALRKQAAEVPTLRKQVEELTALRKQAAEVPALKKQLQEMAALRKQAEELPALRKQAAEVAALRKAAEELAMMKKEVPAVKEMLKDAKAIRAQLDEHKYQAERERKALERVVEAGEDRLRAARQTISDHATIQQQTHREAEQLKATAQQHAASAKALAMMLADAHTVLRACTEFHAKTNLADSPLFSALADTTKTVEKFLAHHKPEN